MPSLDETEIDVDATRLPRWDRVTATVDAVVPFEVLDPAGAQAAHRRFRGDGRQNRAHGPHRSHGWFRRNDLSMADIVTTAEHASPAKPDHARQTFLNNAMAGVPAAALGGNVDIAALKVHAIHGVPGVFRWDRLTDKATIADLVSYIYGATNRAMTDAIVLPSEWRAPARHPDNPESARVAASTAIMPVCTVASDCSWPSRPSSAYSSP